MSRTSLGQRNESQRQSTSSFKQFGSTTKPQNLEEKYNQPILHFQEEIQTFLFMKEKFARVQRQNQYLNCQLGQTYSAIKDDYGLYIFPNGDRYIGEWKTQKMQGQGIYMFYNTDPHSRLIYLGDFKDGLFHGIGKLGRFVQSQGQTIYYGSWQNGKRSQLGTSYYNPSSYYFGYWAQDRKQGEGKLIFANGEYVGNWEQDKRHGYGRLRKVQRGITQVYQGNWEYDDLPFGKVVYYDQNNVEIGKYQGTFVMGRKEGRGTYQWKGASYEGQFLHDTIQGEGVLKINKTALRGSFSSEFNCQNSPQMKAVLLYQNGDQFDGVVAVRDGKIMRLRGLYRYNTGDTAQGEFRDGGRELLGHFMYMWANGESKQFG